MNNQSKHTPMHTDGPWMAKGRSIQSNQKGILNGLWVATLCPTAEWKANARLIASSPDLLSVLRAAHKWAMLKNDASVVPWLEDAEAAIIAATGSNSFPHAEGK